MKARPRIAPVSVLAALFSLAACGPAVNHPSLAPRAIERLDAMPPSPPPPTAAIPVDASKQERIAALLKQAHDGDVRFQPQAMAAEGAVERGAGGAPGSEAWIAAQEAVSRVESLRTPVAQSLADLDELQIASAGAPLDPDTATALAAAYADLSAIDERQRNQVASLKGRITPF